MNSKIKYNLDKYRSLAMCIVISWINISETILAIWKQNQTEKGNAKLYFYIVIYLTSQRL